MKLSCPDCGTPITVPDGDLVLPDLRCPSCTELAAQREQRTRTRTGLAFVGIGLAALVIVVLMARAGVNPGERPSTNGMDGDFGLVGILAFGGLSCLVVGLTYLPRLLRRRLKT